MYRSRVCHSVTKKYYVTINDHSSTKCQTMPKEKFWQCLMVCNTTRN